MARHHATDAPHGPQRFDRALLAQPVAARIAYFDQRVTVLHPRQEQAYLELWRIVQQPVGLKEVFLVGPSGVGKTTLLRKLTGAMIARAMPDLLRSPGDIPLCAVTAEGAHAGVFNWGRLFEDILAGLAEPHVAAKIDPDRVAAKLTHWGPHRVSLGRKPTVDALRHAVEHALQQRHLQAVCIDEAHHVAKVGTGRRLKDHADCLKSLADRSGTVFVLLGTYELLALRKQGDQLSRRTRTIHFPRYHSDCVAEVEVFKRCLLTFEHYLPVEEPPSLLTEWEYLFDRSVGCIGTLKDWLVRALSAALHEVVRDQEGEVRYADDGTPLTTPAVTVTRAHLEQTALPVDDCLNIATLANLGEVELEATADDADALHTLLFAPLPTAPDGRQRAGPRPHPIGTASAHRLGRHPGARTPHRDPVGRGREAGPDA